MTDFDDEVLEAAAHWLAVLKTGAPSRQQRRALKVWLGRDRKHAAALDLVMDVWEQARPADAARPVRAPTSWRARPRPLWWTVPAGLTLAGFAAVALLQPTASRTYTTAVGQVSVIALPDHSVVWLDTNSVLKVALSPLRRTLSLEQGEAAFQVAHEPFRAFVVSTPNTVVRATGTQFSVRYDNGASRVALIQGRVIVKRQSTRGTNTQDTGVALGAGYALLVPDGGPTVLSSANTDAELAWRQGQLVFYQRPMAEVVAEFSRYSRVRVRFADDDAKGAKVSGVFRATALPAFLRDMQALHRIRFHTDNSGEIVIQSAE